jgi:CheY-like chemotaxis protein
MPMPTTMPHARAALVQRLADAIRLPAGHVMALGTRLDWDLDALVRAADGDGALVFRRIADLHRSGAPRAGLVVADASGATLARAGALDLLPRARQLDCPVWPLHRAGPNGVVRADVQLSAGDRRVVLALGRPDGMASDMLVFAASPRIDTAPPAPHLAVGPGCRICTHRACPQRREPSVVEAEFGGSVPNPTRRIVGRGRQSPRGERMTRRVLIVEDEPHIVESLTFLLTREGFEVQALGDGDAALAALAGELPAVLVLDAMLPGADGFEILRRLRSDPRCAKLPILMLTARGQRRDRAVADALGADRFMTKPCSNAEVVASVQELAG